MNRTRSIAAALLLAAAAVEASPPPPTTTPAPKSKAHGLTAAGMVTSLDEPARKMTVKTSSGRQVALVWTGATKTFGGEVRAGLRVTVRYLEKDGKNIAMSIRVEPEKPVESAASGSGATPTATVSAGAKNR